MTITDILFLIPLFVFGIAASWFDIKKGIIPNKLIVTGFVWGLSFYGALFLLKSLAGSDVLYMGVLWKIIDTVIAVLVGYFLWGLNFWSAGDGKLFGLYAFLMPLTFYSESYIDYFPSFNLLINLFVPLLFIILIKTILAAVRRRNDIKKIVARREFWSFGNLEKYFKKIVNFLFTIAMAMIIINFIQLFFREVLLVEMNGFVVLGLLVLIMHFYGKLIQKVSWLYYLKYIIVGIFFSVFLFQQEYLMILIFLKMILAFALLVGLLKEILLFYIRNEEVKKVSAADVQEGMVLSKELEKLLFESISKLKKNNKDKHFKNIEAGGLTKKQAEIIRELFEGNKRYVIEICSVLPFAPFLLLGATISITTSSSFIPYISNFFNMITAF